VLGSGLLMLLATTEHDVHSFSISSLPRFRTAAPLSQVMDLQERLAGTKTLLLQSAKGNSNNGNSDNDKPPIKFYSDDCFGLIFLSSAFLAHDVVFAACFALLSGLAAFYFNNNLDEFDAKLQRQLPAAVAGLTLLFVAPVTRVVTQPTSIEFLPQRESFAPMLEIGVVAASVMYALLRTQKKKKIE